MTSLINMSQTFSQFGRNAVSGKKHVALCDAAKYLKQVEMTATRRKREIPGSAELAGSNEDFSGLEATFHSSKARVSKVKTLFCCSNFGMIPILVKHCSEKPREKCMGYVSTYFLNCVLSWSRIFSTSTILPFEIIACACNLVKICLSLVCKRLIAFLLL
jgi:hypothetical protein